MVFVGSIGMSTGLVYVAVCADIVVVQFLNKTDSISHCIHSRSKMLRSPTWKQYANSFGVKEDELDFAMNWFDHRLI